MAEAIATPMNQPRRDFHFVFGLKPQNEPLHIAFFLALESCRQTNEPSAIHFHYRNEPHGPYWDRIKPHLTLHKVTGSMLLDSARYQSNAEGRFIVAQGLNYAHEADVLRLEILRDAGGCYADMDTLFVRRYPDQCFEHEFAIAEENPLPNSMGILAPSLCNAVMFAKPRSRFITRWLDDLPQSFDGSWSAHSCQAAARLARFAPDEVSLLPWAWFYRFGVSRAALTNLFERNAPVRHDVMSIHLWSRLWWSEARRDFSDFNAELMSEAHIRSVDTTYNCVARRYL